MKRIRLKAPSGLNSTGIYGAPGADGKATEYEPGSIIEVADDFDFEKHWPERAEAVDAEDRVISKNLTADGAEAQVKALREQLALAEEEADAIRKREQDAEAAKADADKAAKAAGAEAAKAAKAEKKD